MEITVQGFLSGLSAMITRYEQSSFSLSGINIHRSRISGRQFEMSVDRRAGSIWNGLTSLSGDGVRGRDMVRRPESLIGCLVLIQSPCSVVPLEWNFVGGMSRGHGSNSILDMRI